MKKISFEDLKDYKGFDEIDKKVKFIEENRKKCEFMIRELNQSIDLDYVKQSEMIEDNRDHELSELVLDENTKVLYSEPKVPWQRLKEVKDEEEYYDLMREQREASTIVLVKTNKDGTETVKEYKNSGHLKALGYALRQARKERKEIQSGKNPEMESDFIEYVNEKLLSSLLAGGPTAGFGRYRSRVYRYGEFSEINVRVSGARFSTTPGAQVYDEMHDIVREYNESDLHPILKAIVFKSKFIRIHPFSDFNGRTSRILLNYMLVRYGYPTVTIKGRHREKYLNALESAIVDDDYSQIIDIIKKLINDRCDKYISIIKEFTEDNKLELD